jgi:hypothetical protein
MTPSSKLSRIRPFTEEDIPQVADLHRRVFGTADHSSPELLDAYRTYLTQVYLNNPWRDDAVSPLVYREDGGKISGFLGVVPRRMSMNGHSLQAAITTNFAVDARSRGFVGVALLTAVLAGPQDLTIADESNATSRAIWEALGGTTSLLYSMRWFYPLRPCRFALFVVRKKKLVPSFIPAVAAPVARALDALAARILIRPLRSPEDRFFSEDMDYETLSSCLSEEKEKQSLRADYDDHSLSWVLQRADQMPRNGCLQKVLVKTERQEIAGWCLYYLNPGGVSEVVQFHAKTRFAHDVLNHLFYRAWRQGATLLSGRMEPHLMQEFSDKHCLFHCGPQWLLVHSRRPELLRAFDRDDVCFSRLDGEWCFHFQ